MVTTSNIVYARSYIQSGLIRTSSVFTALYTQR